MIRTLPTTPLPIIFQYMFKFEVIFKSITGPDDNFWMSWECSIMVVFLPPVHYTFLLIFLAGTSVVFPHSHTHRNSNRYTRFNILT